MGDDDDDWDDDFEAEFEAAKAVVKPTISTTNWSCLQIHPSQSQNPVLNQLTETPYQLNDQLGCDFAPSTDVAIVYVSLKYHQYRPKYAEERLNAIDRSKFRVIVLLLVVDTTAADLAARHLSVLCTKLSCTLLVAFSQSEAAQYIVNFKRVEHKPVDWLRPKLTADSNRHAKVLSHARGVNSTDAATLLTNFGSLGALTIASKSAIVACPGLGDAKADRLVELFHSPFKQ